MNLNRNTGILATAIVIGISSLSAHAQQDRNPNSITLDLKDAPIRTVIEMAFKQAGITNYVIDNNVAGFVTMTITEQPFENALKLIMRAATTPLTYIKENNVYIVKPRQITQSNPTPAPDLTQEVSTRNNVSFERIPLIFIDPIDLMGAFGNITFIRQFNRAGGGGGGAYSGKTSGTGTSSTGGGGAGGASGTANTGGGGGGANVSTSGGTGGSGIVILKYPNTYTATFSGGLTAGTVTSGPNKISTVTNGTGTVSFGI
jgi:hypothetical protein